MPGGRNTHGYKTLKKNFSKLSKAMEKDLKSVCDVLVDESLITSGQRDKAMNPTNDVGERASNLASVLLNKVDQEENNFYKLIGVLQSLPETFEDFLKNMGAGDGGLSGQAIGHTSTPDTDTVHTKQLGDRLTINDSATVIRSLWGVRHKFEIIGRSLGVNEGTLSVARQKKDFPDQALSEVINTWLKGTDPLPTWKALVKALRDTMVEESALADTIAEKHCPTQLTGGLSGQAIGHTSTPDTDTVHTKQLAVGQRTQPDSETTDSDTPNTSNTPMFDKSVFKEIALPKPADGTDQFQELETFSMNVSIILHTVNDNEHQAVLEEMGPPDIKSQINSPIKYLNGNIVGTFGGYRAALVQTKMGSNCSDEIKEALKRFPNAVAVLAIGIAWGKMEYNFGDVLVSKHIYGVKDVKFGENKLVLRPNEISVVPISDDLMRIFTRETKTWSFQCSKEPRNAQVHCGSIVSPPWLVANRSMRDKLLEACPASQEVIGGEMEGGQLASIQHELRESRKIGIIVIKGVADYADEDKQDGKKWQFTAAKSAASYTKNRLLSNPEDIKITSPDMPQDTPERARAATIPEAFSDDLSATDLVSWLSQQFQKKNLTSMDPSVRQKMIDEDINGEAFLQFEDSDLAEMGFTKKGQRIKIMKIIQSIKKGSKEE